MAHVPCECCQGYTASKRHDNVFDADWLPMHSARTLKKRCPSVASEVGTKSGLQECNHNHRLAAHRAHTRYVAVLLL